MITHTPNPNILNQLQNLSTEELQNLLQLSQALHLMNQGGIASPLMRHKQQETNDELAKLFFEKLKENRRAEGTIETYQTTLLSYLTWLGDKPASEITFQDALAYIRYLRREKNGKRVYEASTINNRHSALSSFYTFICQSMNYAETNFFSKEHIEQLPADEVNITVTYLTQSQAQRFLKAILESPNNRGSLSKIRDYTLYRLMITSGVRIGEAIKLKLSDFDFEKGVLTIRREVGKRRKARKTVLDKGLKPFLEEYLKEREKLNSTHEVLFLNQKGNPINRRKSLNAIKRYAMEANLWNEDARITNHVLRHTFATLMITRGENITQVSKMLGHANADFSYKHYISNNIEEINDNVFEGLFDDNPTKVGGLS